MNIQRETKKEEEEEEEEEKGANTLNGSWDGSFQN